jgi:hypothetical protein
MSRCSTALLASLLAASVVGLACGRCRLPPGPRDPAANLALHEAFAAEVERYGLERAWASAVDPGAPPRFAGTPGLLPLQLLAPCELAALRDRLGSHEERARLDRLTWRVTSVQALSTPRQAALLGRIVAVRARHGVGGDPGLDRTLAEEPDAGARRAAWLATAAAGRELAPLVRELASERNRWAGDRGLGGFLTVVARTRGVAPDTASRMEAEVRDAVAPRTGEPLADPWDGEAADPALLARIGARLDVGGAPTRASDVLVWAGLPAHPPGLKVHIGGWGGVTSAACLPADPPGDVRVLLMPSAGCYGHWTTLHEMGHAAQALLAPRGGPVLDRRIASPAVGEACAKLAERLVFAPEWLRRQGVVDADVVALESWETASERWRARRILADTAFERALYADPEADLDSVDTGLQAGLAGLRQPVPGTWAVRRDLVLEPLGRLDYLLARCAQAAVYRRLRSLPGGLLGGEASRVLRNDVLGTAPGSSFEAWFWHAAGEAPGCRAWIEDVARVGHRPETR